MTERVFNNSVQYARRSSDALDGFAARLNDSIYTPPSISVQWQTVAPPNIESLPNIPTLPIIQFNAPPNAPSVFVPSMVDVQIDDFNEPVPVLNFGVAPTMTIGSVPAIPTPNAVALPDAPTIVMPDAPQYLTLTTHTFPGVNLHEDWLAKLQEVPTLDMTLLQPTPMRYERGPGYASQLLENLKGVINQRLKGGTGLNPTVEQALWDRARDREAQIALANEADVMRASEALGFALPVGSVAAQLRATRQEYHNKLSSLSRDISIKQAELEQENLKQAITEGIQLESQLMDYAIKLEQMTFEAAKVAADNSIQLYNVGIEKFKALMTGFQTFASAYETIIKSEQTKVEVYKAELEGEKIKADINTSMVQQYKAEIEGSMSRVEIYKAQVSSAQVLVDLEKSKMEAAGEQIRAFVAGINAETAKVEIYKAGISAESMKMEGYKSLTQAYAAKAGAQAEKSRAEIAKMSAMTQAKGIEWDGYKALILAETSRIDALGKQSTMMIDGYRAAATAVESRSSMAARMWEAQIRQYEATQNISISTAKINADIAQAANAARSDAAKTGAQVYSQLTASAMGMVNANVSEGFSQSLSESYSDSYSTSESLGVSI